MEIESRYKKTVEVKEIRYLSETSVLDTFLAFLFSLLGFGTAQFVISGVTGNWDVMPGELAFVEWGTLPSIAGLALGPMFLVLANEISQSGNSVSNSVTGLGGKGGKNTSKTLYGNFNIGNSGCYLPSLETKFPHNPLLNPYKIEETLDKTMINYNLKQEVTETPLGIWNKTMEAIENENQK